MVDLFATIIPVELSVRVRHANQIVLGEVVEQFAYWDDSKHNIYTTHRVKVTAYLKGKQTEQYIQLITLGGIVEDEAQTVFPNIELEIGKEYCLFMVEAPMTQLHPEIARARTNTSAYFQAFAHVQGVLPLSNALYLDNFSQNRWTETALIEEISVFRAGTIEEAEEMIIKGTDFGDEIGTIEFTNSNSGGLDMGLLTYETDILYWTDSEIRLKVPAFAGTGYTYL